MCHFGGPGYERPATEHWRSERPQSGTGALKGQGPGCLLGALMQVEVKSAARNSLGAIQTGLGLGFGSQTGAGTSNE
jgi:hypothetical protein